MEKLLCFDLDNTLAPLNRPIPQGVITQLINLQEKGHKILFVSGKPTAYIAGVVRQTGLKEVFVSGGNGEILSTDHFFPPENVIKPHLKQGVSAFIMELKEAIIQEYNERVWLQPNESQLTIFHYEDRGVEKSILQLIETAIEKHNMTKEIKYYTHSDCIDVLPVMISKGNIVKELSQYLNMTLDQTVTIGDGENDVSMFQVSGLSIGINVPEHVDVSKRVSSIDAALSYITETI